MTHKRTTRGFAAALAVVAALALAACSGSTSPQTTQGEPTGEPTTTSADGQFPVTLENKFGTTTIESQPTRVVSVGYHEQDWLYAFGIAPVGVREWYNGYDYATWPWAEAARKALNAEPVVLANADIDIEAVAALNPDLILATWSGITKEQYDLLSQIAPVVAQSGDFADYGMPFNDETRMIAKAVGKVTEGEKIISDLDATYTEIREAHPDWAQSTAAVAFTYEGQPGAYFSYDPRAALLGNFGLNIKDIDKLGTPGTDFYITVSPENLDKIDSDTLVWLGAISPDMRTEVEGMALFPQMNATVKGGHIWSTDPVFEGAFSFASPLSLPFAIDRLVPQLELAVDGDPATLPAGIDPAA